MLFRSIELSNQEKKNADVNNDGKIDETDISLVQERINGNTNVFLQYRIVDGDLSSILPKITSVQPMPKPTPTPSTKPTSTPSETTIPTSNPISDSRPSSGSNSNSQVSVDNLTSSVENKTERSKNILYLVVSVVGVSVIGMIGLIFKKVRK